MEFRKLTFENFVEIERFMPKDLPPEEFLCEASALALEYETRFLNLEFADFEKTMIMFSKTEMLGKQYRFPFGENPEKALEKIFEIEDNPSFFLLTKSQAEAVCGANPSYVMNSIRDYFDYVYDGEKLRTLSGKKMQKKRNHFNAFCNEFPAARYMPMNAELAQRCLQVYPKWIEEHSQCDDYRFKAEKEDLKCILGNWDRLGLKGGAIILYGEIIAFTVSEQVNDSLAIIHFEKADRRYRGAYVAINKWHVENAHSETKYINRQDDGGIEGLRKAKTSYRPAFMVEKFWVANKTAMRRTIRAQRNWHQNATSYSRIFDKICPEFKFSKHLSYTKYARVLKNSNLNNFFSKSRKFRLCFDAMMEPVWLTDEIDLDGYENVYIYESMKGEVQTGRFIEVHSGKRFFVPEGHHPADFVGTPPKEGNFGAPDGEEVEEARRGAPTFIALDSGEVAEPDLIIVPGLAFSKDGDRLGFGGGWYDRFLARWPNVMKIGIVQKEFLLDRVPVEEHDVRVDRVIVIYAIREDDFK